MRRMLATVPLCQYDVRHLPLTNQNGKVGLDQAILHVDSVNTLEDAVVEISYRLSIGLRRKYCAITRVGSRRIMLTMKP